MGDIGIRFAKETLAQRATATFKENFNKNLSDRSFSELQTCLTDNVALYNDHPGIEKRALVLQVDVPPLGGKHLILSDWMGLRTVTVSYDGKYLRAESGGITIRVSGMYESFAIGLNGNDVNFTQIDPNEGKSFSVDEFVAFMFDRVLNGRAVRHTE